MNNTTFQKSLLPQIDGRALDFIKICAAIFMVIDHVNATLLNRGVYEMLLIGRATFPLFCYALAIAILRVGDEKAPRYGWRVYGLRLLILGIVTEPIARFSRDVTELNILFTLALGAALAGLSVRMKDWHLYLCVLIAVILHAFPSPVEGGAVGIILPTIILSALKGRRAAFAILVFLIFMLNIPEYPTMLAGFEPMMAALSVLIFGLAAGLPSYLALCIARLLPQNGRWLHKYALHIFYPGHLLLLWAIGHFIMKIN